MAYPSQYGPVPVPDLHNWNTDRSVDPPTMVRGMMYKSSAGAWEYWDGSITATATTSPLSADGSSVSAIQADATKLRMSAFSNDAALMRVSAVGVAVVGGISANEQLSARMLEGTAFIGSVSSTVTLAASQSLSARILEGTAFIGSVSSTTTLVASQALSATLKEGTAFVGSVSANQAGTWAISALGKEGTAFLGQVSAKSNDASQVRVSVFSGNGGSMVVSAIPYSSQAALADAINNTAYRPLSDNGNNLYYGSNLLGFNGTSWDRVRTMGTSGIWLGSLRVGQDEAALMRVSGIQGDGANMNVSAKSNDAGTLRTSSYIPVDTVGQLTAFRSLSLSASQAIKATAGAIHGYYLWNTTTVPQYVKFTNTSGAINVGTDTPVFMAMLPASAAANIWFGQGLKGFTAGIGVHATSAVADNATTPAAASAVGGTIFYN